MSEENTETIVDPALTAGDPPPADPPQDPIDPPEPPEPPKMVPQDVFIRKIAEVRSRAQESETALDEHRRQLSEARALIERLQRGQPDPNAPPAPAPRDPLAGKQFTEDDVKRAAVELNFQEKARTVFQAGAAAYGQKGFDDACNLMNSFGLNNAEFVSSIMEIGGVEKTHEIFHAIAQEPEKVAALAGMTSIQRAREITRIADKMSAKPAAAVTEDPKPPPARTVSRAPNPPPRVDPSASQVVDWRSDKASDQDFSKGWEENMARRRGARR